MATVCDAMIGAVANLIMYWGSSELLREVSSSWAMLLVYQTVFDNPN